MGIYNCDDIRRGCGCGDFPVCFIKYYTLSIDVHSDQTLRLLKVFIFAFKRPKPPLKITKMNQSCRWMRDCSKNEI